MAKICSCGSDYNDSEMRDVKALLEQMNEKLDGMAEFIDKTGAAMEQFMAGGMGKMLMSMMTGGRK